MYHPVAVLYTAHFDGPAAEDIVGKIPDYVEKPPGFTHLILQFLIAILLFHQFMLKFLHLT